MPGLLLCLGGIRAVAGVFLGVFVHFDGGQGDF